jgi:putative spermidine/putrescine transport system substrate-binding protein
MERSTTSVGRRTAIAAVALAWALAAAGAGDALAQQKFAGQTLRLHVWGGLEGAMIKKHVLDPFEKATGAKVVVEEGWTSAAVAKLQAQKADPKLDVVMFDDIGVVQASREGLLHPIDFSKIPNAKDVPSQYVFEKDKGIGFYQYLLAIAYSTEAFKTAPDSWKALWDPKLKGKVILPALDGTTIHKVLMIASFMHGGSQTNVEPGVQALMKLKSNVHSHQKNSAFIAEALRSGDASIVAWQPNVLKEYIEKGYPVKTNIQLKEGIFATPGCVSIVKGHKASAELLHVFIDYALSPEAQLGFAKDFWQSPTNRKVKVPDDIKHIVLPAEGSAVKNIPVDLEAFHQSKAANLEKLNKIFLQ